MCHIIDNSVVDNIGSLVSQDDFEDLGIEDTPICDLYDQNNKNDLFPEPLHEGERLTSENKVQ